MKRHTNPLVPLAVIVAALLVGFAALGAGVENASAPVAKAATAEWLVESHHTPQSCVAAIDEYKALGPKLFADWKFGCEGGVHVAWMTVRAPDAQTALQVVPASLRGEAKAYKLNKFTLDQLKAFHQREAAK